MSAMHLKCTNITLNLGRDEAVKGQVSCVVVNELTLEVQPLPGVNQATWMELGSNFIKVKIPYPLLLLIADI